MALQRGTPTAARRSSPSVLVIWLTVAIVGLLATGVLGVALHRQPASVAVGRQPQGVKALVDATDKLGVDVPFDWQTPVLTAGSYGDAIRAFIARNLQFSAFIKDRLPSLSAADRSVGSVRAIAGPQRGWRCCSRRARRSESQASSSRVPTSMRHR